MSRACRLHGAAFVALLLAGTACDRAVEPFDPNEKVEAPDLSKIFPAGAERAPEDAPMGAPAGGGGPPGMAARGAAAASAEGGPIRGRVALAAELAARVPRGAVLFLIARTSDAGPPVAVKRIPEPEFPLSFEIGPDDRMMEGVPFVGPFQLSARVDADGNAASRNPGDLQGETRERVAPGARGVELVIDRVL